MSGDSEELKAAVEKSVAELHRGIEAHGQLMASVLARDEGVRAMRAFREYYPRRSREKKLAEAIRKAIETIEDTRKSFKSRKLESLRRSLARALEGSE